MREILFRGKQMSNGKWIEGFYFKQPNPMTEDGFPTRHCISDLPPFGAEVIPETVGQYTGLTDKNGKNGKKIFEGDIVNFSNILYYIVFADGCFRICRNGKYSYTLHNLHSAFEVIGNIHDNPELLKGE